MKKYIKPSVSVIEFETGAPLLSAMSDGYDLSVEPQSTNTSNRAKEYGFDLWADDED